jgi:hypothetical protein
MKKKLPTSKELNEAWYNEPQGRKEFKSEEIPDAASDQAGKALLDRFKKIASSYRLTPTREYRHLPSKGTSIHHPLLFGKPKETVDFEGHNSSYGLLYVTPKKKYRMQVSITIDKNNINEPYVYLDIQQKDDDTGGFDDEHPIFVMYRIRPDDRTHHNGETGTLEQILAKFNELCPQIAKGVISESNNL